MKRLLVLLVVSTVAATVASADTAPGLRPNVQRILGGFRSNTGGATASGSAQLITGVSLACGGTAGAVGIYDAAGAYGATAANGVYELTAAANVGAYVDFKDHPIRTTTGVIDVETTSCTAAIYVEQNVP